MPDLVSGILFLAPGFLALKLFYLLGAQRVRSEWEWTTWSVIASLPINGVASVLRDMLPIQRSPIDPVEIALRLLLGVAVGAAAGGSWRIVRGSKGRRARELRRFFGASAWDEALEDADRYKRQAELVLDGGTKYVGTIAFAGREDNKAEAWVYLIHPEVFDEATKKYRPAKQTHGLLVHRDQIERIRILMSKEEADAAKAAHD